MRPPWGARSTAGAAAAAGAVLVAAAAQLLRGDGPPPQWGADEWWGAGAPPDDSARADTVPRRFSVPRYAAELADLRERLRQRRAAARSVQPQPAGGAEASAVQLREVLDRWESGYDWAPAATALSALPQWTMELAGLRIHYIHARSSSGAFAPALLLLHGGPGGAVEVSGLADSLRADFHVVAPSMPGHGWSDPPARSGLCPAKMAPLLSALMRALGYARYFVHGGDWGALAALTTFPAPLTLRGLLATPLVLLQGASERAKLWPVSEAVTRLWRSSGLTHLMATSPETVVRMIADSPAALAAWELERRAQLGCGGAGVELLLAELTVAWATGSAAASVRLCAAAAESPEMREALAAPVGAPTALLEMTEAQLNPPKVWAAAKYRNIVKHTVAPGGQLVAVDRPEVVVNDILSFAAQVMVKGG
eukprot:TRINITY_DN32862_c0_g1_i1.p1 TRINITY_DN32862_c0_g1~~TRINITY_DN32862_c0_g1_i1.p1  ORF type:complete len:450 (+),score=138.23 TRINITY_DN32862_c0_g1_i1:80-1351(+)